MSHVCDRPTCRGHRVFVGGRMDGQVDHLVYAAPSDYYRTLGTLLSDGQRSWYVRDGEPIGDVTYRFAGIGRDAPQAIRQANEERAMNPCTEVPEWCRAELEDAISDAVTRWVLKRVDRMGENATPTNALSVIFALTAGDRQEVARDVIAALQGVGVPFSEATGAGAEYEATPPRRVMVADPVRGEQLATAANGDAATTWRCEDCGATVHYWPFDGIPGAVCEYVRGETADYSWVAHAPRCVGVPLATQPEDGRR